MNVQMQAVYSQGDVAKLAISKSQLLSNLGARWYDLIDQCCIGRHYSSPAAADVSIRPVVDLPDQVLKLEQFRK